MKLPLLLAFFLNSMTLPDAVSAAENWAPETSSACVSRTHKTPADCLLSVARTTLTLCGSQVELSILMFQTGTTASEMGGRGDASCANAEGKWALADHYQATLKQFARKKEVQNRTKEYYARWRAAMSGLMPGMGELKISYNTRVNRQAAELEAIGERLLLEK